ALANRASTYLADPTEQRPSAPRDHEPRHKSRASCKPLAASRPRTGPPRPPAFPGQSPEWPPFGDTKQRRARASIAFVIGNGDAGSKQCLAWIASPRRLSKGTLLVKKLLRTHLAGPLAACLRPSPPYST